MEGGKEKKPCFLCSLSPLLNTTAPSSPRVLQQNGATPTEVTGLNLKNRPKFFNLRLLILPVMSLVCSERYKLSTSTLQRISLLERDLQGPLGDAVDCAP